MSEDLNVITNDDKRHLAYGLCVLGTMATGATLGSMAGGQTLLGAAGGTVFGLFACKQMSAPIKSKLFSRRQRMSEQEFKQALLGARHQFPNATKAQLLNLLASSRLETTRQPAKYQC
jgi:hypothetical protein